MNIHKIRQYSTLQLVRLAFFKIMYSCVLLWEQIGLTLFQRSYPKCKYNYENDSAAYKHVIQSMKSYYDLCNTDKNVIKKAEIILSGKIEVFGNIFDFNYKKDWLKDPVSGNFWNKNVFFPKAPYIQYGCNDVKYVLEINKMNHLVNLAHAYYCTKDKKYIDGLEKQLDGWFQCVQYEKSVVNRIMMDLSFRAINLIQISLLCAENVRFVQLIHPKIIRLLYSFESLIRRFSTPRWFKTGNGDNHVTGEMVGLLATQLWLKEVTGKDYSKHYKKELKHLIGILDKTIAPSGAYLEESDNYTRVVSEFLVFLDICIKNLRHNDKHFERYMQKQYLERLLCYLKNLSYYDMLPNVGDNDNARVLVAHNNNFGVDYVTDFLDTLGYEFKKCSEYKDAGHYVYHSSDKNDVYLFVRAGQFSIMREGAGTHCHNDLLSVVLSVGGQQLFVDKGCSFYNMGKELRNECKSSLSHNTPVIDGCEMAEITPRGHVNYPKAFGTIRKNNSECFEFSGRVSYKDIQIDRSIEYANNIIYITDTIYAQQHKSGIVTFLLAKDVEPTRIDNQTVVLKFTNKTAVISFTNITDYIIADDRYYPRFAEEVKTKKIVNRFNLSESKSIRTVIQL